MTLGLLKTGLIDFPGRIAATIFFSGCNLRCPWCHNADLVYGSPPSGGVSIGELEKFLEKRRSVLGGVCLTGGEPLLSPRLEEVVSLVLSAGLEWKLDSNGTLPAQLEKLLNRFHNTPPALIAFDYKGLPAAYPRRLSPPAGLPASGGELFASLECASAHRVPYELRSTFTKEIVSLPELKEMARLLRAKIESQGIAEPLRWKIQPFRPGTCLDPRWNGISPPSEVSLREAEQLIRSFGFTF